MKIRLDLALVQRGLASGRDRARALVMSGLVYVNGQKADKAGEGIKETDTIEVRGEQLRYVSRGGLKLERAIEGFLLRLDGCVCCDFGASTGGFTDCMLQNGAKKVYAFDVGYGQLAWSLRQDPRVVSRERTNVRYLTGDEVNESIDFISADLSFISLTLILPVIYEMLSSKGRSVCLIKPQFEAGREKVGKKGVVRDWQVHHQVIQKVMDAAQVLGFFVEGALPSPIKGPMGNVEYLLCLSKLNCAGPDASGMANAAVEAAQKEHGDLNFTI